MMGKDGQHVKESSSTAPTASSSHPPHHGTTDDPLNVSPPPAASLPSAEPLHSVPQVAVIPPGDYQVMAPPWSSHMTSSHVTSSSDPHQSQAMMFLPSRPGLVPPPPIPNIVVDPVLPRDAFGHSRTPPFVPSPSEWGSSSRTCGGSKWNLTIPGLGKKPRAHSDSSIMIVDREQQMPTYPAGPASAVDLPPPGQEGHSVFHFEESYVAPRGVHRVPYTRGGIIRQAAVTEGPSSTATIPMETDRPSISQQGGGEPGGALDLALAKQPSMLSPPSLALVPEGAARGPMDKPSVPFLWHFQSHKGFEKSPKTYWLRRHSDSNLPSEPQDLSTAGVAGEGATTTSAHDPPVSSIRSHSTGDTGVTRGRSEGDTPLASPLLAPGPRDSPEHPPPAAPPGSRKEEEVVSKRLKLKKYLQKRYQLSLRRRQTSDTDDVFSDRGPETPSPGPLAASQGFTYHHHHSTAGSSTSLRTESVSLEGAEDPAGSLRAEQQAPPPAPARRPPLSLAETVPIKTEPISPCESEGEPETPVFVSPSFLPVRGHSESPRWQGNVFQFHGLHPSHGEPEASPEHPPMSSPPQLSPISPPGQQQQRVSRASDWTTPQQLSPAATTSLPVRPTSLDTRLPAEAVSSHLGSQLSPLPVSLPYAQHQQPPPPMSPSTSSASTTQGPLPPFSTMLQRPSLPPRPQAPPYSYAPTPFASYSQGAPLSPAATAALGAPPPWEAGLPSTSPGHQPPPGPQQYSPSSLPRTSPPQPPPPPHGSGGGSSKSEPSKIIYCPFSEKVQEQRHSRDPNTTFMCPVCGQVFPSYNYLANHMVNHLPSEVVTKGPGDSNKVHLCKVCNRAFSRSDMLTRHMRLHTGLRPYECRICGQVFSRSDHLHTHLRTHTGEKPYKCPQCPYAAPRRDMITRHMRIHMKQFTRRGRRSSSVSSDVTPSGSSDPSADVKRRNQSLSSVESQDSTESPFRRGSSASEAPDMDSPQAKSRSWSVASDQSLELPPSRHWSATSMESTESYPSPRGEPSRGGGASHYFSFQGTEGEVWVTGSIEEGMEHEASSSPASTTQALSPASDSLTADMHTSFQKCKVTSDKDSTSSSGSDKDTTLSPAHRGGSGGHPHHTDP